MTIEDALGYTFSNKDLLNRALTRKAYANEQKARNLGCEDQEIFRTLGDAVLKTVLVDLLIASGCKTGEEITNRKMELESEEGLAKISRELGIGNSIKLGIGEIKQRANEKQYVLAETLEALIGAIYLDSGFGACRKTIIKWFRI
ncbi:MAG: dsRNA-specific ribonuclease [Euryarchaeota archaeon]|nr:dsRNA-specific ribonuclease [Euryarchaeota archaeon]